MSSAKSFTLIALQQHRSAAGFDKRSAPPLDSSRGSYPVCARNVNGVSQTGRSPPGSFAAATPPAESRYRVMIGCRLQDRRGDRQRVTEILRRGIPHRLRLAGVRGTEQTIRASTSRIRASHRHRDRPSSARRRRSRTSLPPYALLPARVVERHDQIRLLGVSKSASRVVERQRWPFSPMPMKATSIGCFPRIIAQDACSSRAGSWVASM